MPRLLRMPGVSADADQAVLETWAVATGDRVVSGTAVATVETDKALVDIEVDRDVVVHTLLVLPGSTVPVGDPIALLLEPGEPEDAAHQLLRDLGVATGTEDGQASAAPAVEPEKAAVQDRQDRQADRPADVGSTDADAAKVGQPGSGPGTEPAATGTTSRRFASPLARRMAKDLGLDLDRVVGSGPRGRIGRDDVLAASAARVESVDAPHPSDLVDPDRVAAPETYATPPARSVSPEPPERPAPARSSGTSAPAGLVPHSRARRLIAARLQQSKRDVPHFYLTRHLAVDALLRLRAEVNEHGPSRVSINDFFVKAAARALVDVPEMNVRWTEDGVQLHDTADVAVAVASERGLVTPVVRGVENLSLTSLSRAIKEAAARADQGRLRQSELEGGTFTVSNLGMYGVDEFQAIINPPQAGILAVAAARERPVVDGSGSLAVATMVTVTLSADHRPVDGAVAARWLGRLAELVESPLSILV